MVLQVQYARFNRKDKNIFAILIIKSRLVSINCPFNAELSSPGKNFRVFLCLPLTYVL